MRISRTAETAAEKIAAEIGQNAYRALLEEVYTTLKPGLVDLYSRGAHTDMDVHTFEKSAYALRQYFIRMAWQGFCLKCSAEALFGEIRKTGMAAEAAMYRATGGVNTHKGLIFTLGIYCAAAGRCMAQQGRISEDALRRLQQEMTADTLRKEIREMKCRDALTHGEENLRMYGTPGVRGEAVSGYPGVWEDALPALRKGIFVQRNYNLVKLQALFVLMSRTEDSNILARKNPAALSRVQRDAADFLKRGGVCAADMWKVLMEMDADYIRENISAGGCADLLAAAVFMQLLLDGKQGAGTGNGRWSVCCWKEGR